METQNNMGGIAGALRNRAMILPKSEKSHSDHPRMEQLPTFYYCQVVFYQLLRLLRLLSIH